MEDDPCTWTYIKLMCRYTHKVDPCLEHGYDSQVMKFRMKKHMSGLRLTNSMSTSHWIISMSQLCDDAYWYTYIFTCTYIYIYEIWRKLKLIWVLELDMSRVEPKIFPLKNASSRFPNPNPIDIFAIFFLQVTSFKLNSKLGSAAHNSIVIYLYDHN